MTIGCSRKAVPANDPCETIIQELIDSISNVEPTYIYDLIPGETVVLSDTVCIVDSSNCNYYKLKALEVAAKYNTLAKERDYYKLQAERAARKIINNINVNSNNRKSFTTDNSVEEDNSIKAGRKSQVGDGNIAQKSKDAANQAGDGNTAPTDNSKKGKSKFWLGVLCATGVLYGLGICLTILEKYFPQFAFFIGILRRFLPNGQ